MANADSIGEQLAVASGPSVAVVIADMTAMFCDSLGMRMLVLARRQAAAVGTDWCCCRASTSCAS
jgi:vacuolar-type H+-ATPase subunit B/Vma2